MNRFATTVSLVLIGLLAAAQQSAAGQDRAPSFRPVSWERLVIAADEPENWLMYSGMLDSQRFSRLEQITTGNVGDLQLKWAYQIPQLDRAETSPLVVDGIMFITESPSNVVAVDGTQYVTIAAGNVVHTFGLAD